MPVCREKLGTADASVDAAKTAAPARAAVQRNLRMVILLFHRCADVMQLINSYFFAF
jgi:hypothetical protein